MKFGFSVLFFFLIQLAFGQRKFTAHQTFELNAEIKNITIELTEEYQIIFWSGNAVLVEKSVLFYEVTDGLYKNLTSSDRYLLENKIEEGKWVLFRDPVKKIPLKNLQGGLLQEEVSFKIYLPQQFKEVDQGFFEKKNL